MLLLAAAVAANAPATEKLRQIPWQTWAKLAAAVVAVIIVVILLRKLAKMNKVVLAAIVFVGLTIVGFNWIYERNEPDWATPVVSWLSGFFPSKGKVERKPAAPPPRK